MSRLERDILETEQLTILQIISDPKDLFNF